jgi:anti-anti-sigma factor
LAHSIHLSSSDPRGTIVVIGGDADVLAAGEVDGLIHKAVSDTLASGGERVIVLDLSTATFVDSRMISVIVSWVEKLGERDWRVPVVCDDERMLGVFSAIGLDGTLDIHPTLDAAFSG